MRPSNGQTRASLFLGAWQSELDSLAAASQFRRLEVVQGLNLCSNDYLGLSVDPRLRDAVAQALAGGCAVGSTGSRLLSGNARIWEEFEDELAQFAGAEAALYFNSGYAANVGLFSCRRRTTGHHFFRRANHASIIDGIRLSGARKVIFPHLDLDFLEDELRQLRTGRCAEVYRRRKRFQHGWRPRAACGTARARGALRRRTYRGRSARYRRVRSARARSRRCSGCGARVFATVHTCGKALAGMGAFVCCSETLKQYLVNRARTFIFSTALPPYVAAQMRAAIGIVAGADAERSRLASLHASARDCATPASKRRHSDSQIVPVLLGGNERAVQFADALSQAGLPCARFARRPSRRARRACASR